MAVYKRSYHGYAGPITPEWSRFTIIPRYAYQRLFKSKVMTVFFILCFIAPLVFLSLIYTANSFGSIAKMFGARDVKSPIAIDGEFFLIYLGVQSFLAFILTAFVGPGLISTDLCNRALTLYLSRPFSRFEYVIGKMSVLLILLSLITWVPGLVLFGVQAALAGGAWAIHNLWIAWAIFAGSAIWSLVIALLALALSAWVKWRIAAGALLVGIFFIGGGLANAIDSVLEVRWGKLLDMGQVFASVWSNLFRVREPRDISPTSSWLMLVLICGACVWLLYKKLRAVEVVR